MPDMTGFELLAHLQQQGSPIPTVIISADVQEASRQQGYELGAVAFLNKPVKAAELQQVVHRYFSQVG
jgi:CheY-like chemotaxis protein